jgi:YhcH/YjgK/YiaL family protein
MILETLLNARIHEGVHPLFPKAFAWLRSHDPATADGRYEIHGPDLVAIVSRYETAPSVAKKWETHRVHGDIQYMVKGSEFIGYARREELEVRIPYNPDKDAEFYNPPAEPHSRFLLSAGSIAVFHPQDAHQPGVMIVQPSEVHKVVIKFRL